MRARRSQCVLGQDSKSKKERREGAGIKRKEGDVKEPEREEGMRGSERATASAGVRRDDRPL